MYKGLTVFRIGLIAIAVGSIWTGVVFASSMKNSENFNLDKMNTVTMSLSLQGKGNRVLRNILKPIQ